LEVRAVGLAITCVCCDSSEIVEVLVLVVRGSEGTGISLADEFVSVTGISVETAENDRSVKVLVDIVFASFFVAVAEALCEAGAGLLSADKRVDEALVEVDDTDGLTPETDVTDTGVPAFADLAPFELEGALVAAGDILRALDRVVIL
jgi:hypothetical protein